MPINLGAAGVGRARVPRMQLFMAPDSSSVRGAVGMNGKKKKNRGDRALSPLTFLPRCDKRGDGRHVICGRSRSSVDQVVTASTRRGRGLDSGWLGGLSEGRNIDTS